MRILVVDDEPLALNNLTALIRQVTPEAEIVSFTEPEAAFAHLAVHGAEIAFLDVEMGEYSGITLAKKCKDLCPQVNIIFVTVYSKYTMDAFRLHASGYLLKPVRVGDLRTELSNLRHPLPSSGKRVRVQCFGHFEIFVEGQPLKFPRTKCKECFAYLVDRKGARVTYAELSGILWEDKPFDRAVQNSTHKVVSDMMKTLRAVDAGRIITKSRVDIAVDATLVDCDYFAALSGDIAQMNAFVGEYMTQYSWAEFTLGGLL